MPFGNSLGEFVFKAMSVRQIEIGGGQKRIEADYGGEVTGEAPGSHYGTLTVVVGTDDDPTKPNPYSWTGTTLATSGGIISISGSGISQRTGEGHKVRLRGVCQLSTTDAKLAMLNKVVGAVEAEVDPANMTLKGAVCEWK
jgi:hypothetical protein